MNKLRPKDVKIVTQPLQFNFDIGLLMNKFKLSNPVKKEKENKVRVVNLKKDRTNSNALF